MLYRLLIPALSLLLAACTVVPKTVSSGGGNQQNASNSAAAAVIIIPKKKKGAEEAPMVTIDWLSPNSADLSVKSIGGKVEIKVRINSQTPITMDQIDILVNGEPAGNKAGEVGLMRRPEYKDQILTAQVPVRDGTNDIQVVVSTAADKIFLAENTLEKSSNGIKVINRIQANSDTRVIWTKPDAFALKAHEMYNTKERELEIRFNITSPETVNKSDLQLLVNKIYRAPSANAEFRGENGSYYFKDVVTLNEDLAFNEIALKVNTSKGAVESQRLKVNFSPIRPNLYILAIGTQTNLRYTVKDARDFAKIFSAQGREMFRLFNSVTIDTLLGHEATTAEIRGSIESIKNKFMTGAIAEDDLVILFFSSHGFIDDRQDLRIQGDDYRPERRMSTSVSYRNDVLAHLEDLPCKKLLFIDACHAGGAKANVADINRALQEYKGTAKGIAVFASSRDDEESHEDVRWANGAFSEALHQGLKGGKADANNNGIITLLELEAYVSKVVPEMVSSVKNKPQHPKLSRNELGDLPIYIVKK